MAGGNNTFAAITIALQAVADARVIQPLHGDARRNEMAKDALDLITQAEQVFFPNDPTAQDVLAALTLGANILLGASGADSDRAAAHGANVVVGAVLTFAAKHNPAHASVYQRLATDFAADVKNNWPADAINRQVPE